MQAGIFARMQSPPSPPGTSVRPGTPATARRGGCRASGRAGAPSDTNTAKTKEGPDGDCPDREPHQDLPPTRRFDSMEAAVRLGARTR